MRNPHTPPAAAEEQPHPFDPALPGEVRAYLDAWKADGAGEYVSQGFFRDGTSRRLTVAQLEELLKQLAWHKQAGEDLAEKCAAYRARAEEAERVARVLASALRIAGRSDRDIAAILRSIGMYGELPTYVGGPARGAEPFAAAFPAADNPTEVPCAHCGNEHGRYATREHGLLGDACHAALYPTDGVPATENGTPA